MSDFDRHPDELISAYLDGEADADEAARIEGDPQSRARAAELAAVIQAVADPVQELTPDQRDRLRARALAAAGPAPVREISEAPRRRWRSVLIPAAAAAGIFAVALGVISVLRGGIDDDAGDSATSASAATTASADGQMAAESAADMSDTAEPAAAEMDAAAEPTAADMGDTAEPADDASFIEEAEAPAPAATSADGDEAMAEAAPDAEAPEADGMETGDQAPAEPSVADLGSFAGPEQLIDHLASRLDGAESALGEPSAEPGPCAQAVAERVDELGGEALIEARAELGAEDGDSADEYGVDLAVVTTEDGGFWLVYAAEPDCGLEGTALE